MKELNSSFTVSDLETKELCRIFFKQKDHYASHILDEIKTELDRRRFILDRVVNTVEYSLNNESTEEGTIDEAIAKLDSEVSNWDTWYFKNYLDEYLSIQKSPSFWIICYFDEAENYSFGIEKSVNIKNILEKFLKLEDWQPAEEDIYSIDDWETFQTSDSLPYIESLADKLEKMEIPFRLQNLKSWHFNAIFGTQSTSNPYVILVPPDFIRDCDNVLFEMEKEVNELLEQLNQAERSNDTSRQLDIYEKLERAMVSDAGIRFNKGCLLADLGRYQEAADAFIESISIDIEKGNIGSAIKSEEKLREIMNHVPDNMNVLHCLALVASTKGYFEEAIELYEKIVSLNNDDSSAHMNLGYLYYGNTDNTDQTYAHFKRYLELEPDAENKESIKEILSELEYS